MASTDREGVTPQGGEGSRRGAKLAWLSGASTWFAGAIIGMAVVFIGLAVDASRHASSASEESLLSFGNPGHLSAAVGLVLGSAAALIGLTLSALRGTTTAEHAIRRLAPVTSAWIALAVVAAGSLVYIATSDATLGHGGLASAAGTGEEAIGIANALQQGGVQTDTSAAANVPGALTQGGAASGKHDAGQQPTFTQLDTLTREQLMPLFPAGTMTAADFPGFKSELDQVRQVALKLSTPELAQKAGYIRTTSDVPYMGEHYLNLDLVKKGTFDPANPQGLLFSKIDGGEEKLVGIWFLLLPGLNGVTRDAQPAGFTGDLDIWHEHSGLCLVGVSGASEGETRESCQAKGGNFTADLRWMLHVWVAPENTENPQGVLAYLNNDLFEKQQAAAKQAENPTGITQ